MTVDRIDLNYSWKYGITVFVELDVQQIFSKDQTTGYSMCAVDGIVSDIFDRLHSLKDDLITIISRKLSNGTEKTGFSNDGPVSDLKKEEASAFSVKDFPPKQSMHSKACWYSINLRGRLVPILSLFYQSIFFPRPMFFLSRKFRRLAWFYNH